jgi:uncharacterized protein (TIGR02231 family)
VVPRGNGAQPQIPNPSGLNQFDTARQAGGQRAMAQQEYLKKDVGNAARLYNEAAALESNWELLHSTREELLAMRGLRPRNSAEEGPSVTYHIPTKLSVPSRQDEQIIEVAKIELKPEYFYKAVPVLTAHVYRQANLNNNSKHILLPGEATMYQGTDFVGRMNVPLVAIGEQFTVGFGVDPQLQVARQLIDKVRSTQGGNQVLKYEYRILINSYKPEAVTLQLWDRLPHADMESVGVSLLKTAPELSRDTLYLREERTHNLLRWDLKVEPAMNGEKAMAVNYEFQLALDRQMTIADFKTREPLPAKR